MGVSFNSEVAKPGESRPGPLPPLPLSGRGGTSNPGRPFLPTLGRVCGLLVVLVGSVVLGGATSLAQGLLPEAFRPFANSASGWTILTVPMVWRARRALRWSAVLGAVSFVALVLGYTLVSNMRGFYFSPVFWSVVGVVVGPWVGVAAAALHQRGRWAALGTGLLAGVLLGDSFYGITAVMATTGWVYWNLVGVLGAALLVAMAVLRLQAARLVTMATVVAAATAVLMNLTFALLSTGAVPLT
jgi:hypothetical protein